MFVSSQSMDDFFFFFGKKVSRCLYISKRKTVQVLHFQRVRLTEKNALRSNLTPISLRLTVLQSTSHALRLRSFSASLESKCRTAKWSNHDEWWRLLLDIHTWPTAAMKLRCPNSYQIHHSSNPPLLLSQLLLDTCKPPRDVPLTQNHLPTVHSTDSRL